MSLGTAETMSFCWGVGEPALERPSATLPLPEPATQGSHSKAWQGTWHIAKSPQIFPGLSMYQEIYSGLWGQAALGSNPDTAADIDLSELGQTPSPL